MLSRRLVRDTRGANLVEYILVVGLVAIVAIVGVRAFGSRVAAKADKQADCVANLGCTQGEVGGTGRPGMPQGKDPAFDKVEGAKDAKYEPVPNPTPFVKGPGDDREIHPSDVDQNQLGDCYLMATLGAFANANSDVLRKNIKDNGDGTYTVTFYDRGLFGTSKVEIKVTPDFPKKGGSYVFAGLGDSADGKNEIWPMLYEKAYAQWKGGYNAIGNGGRPEKVMEALTGNSASSSNLRGLIWDMSFSDFADTAKNNVVVANTRSDGKGKKVFEDGTLVTNHSYWVESVDTDKQTVTVRNPWGWHNAPVTVSWEQFRHAFGDISYTRK